MLTKRKLNFNSKTPWLLTLLPLLATVGCGLLMFPGLLDSTAPTVISVGPPDLATGVRLDQKIQSTFSEAMDPSTMTTNNLVVTGPGFTTVPGAVTYSDNVATFTPAAPLAPDTRFTATVYTAVRDVAGNFLFQNRVWSFTTGSIVAPDPARPGPQAVGIKSGSRAPANVSGARLAANPAPPQPGLDLPRMHPDVDGQSTDSQTLLGHLGGLTFAPGLPPNSTSFLNSGLGFGNNIALDEQGNVNDILVSQLGSLPTTGPGGQVIPSGGDKAANLYWQVAASVPPNTTAIFKETLLAQASITLNTGATRECRAFAQNGAAILDESTLTATAP